MAGKMAFFLSVIDIPFAKKKAPPGIILPVAR